MNTDATIRAALGSGAASFRPLALGDTLILIPDVGLTVVLQPNGLLDFSRCHRMNRCAARRRLPRRLVDQNNQCLCIKNTIPMNETVTRQVNFSRRTGAGCPRVKGFGTRVGAIGFSFNVYPWE